MHTAIEKIYDIAYDEIIFLLQIIYFKKIYFLISLKIINTISSFVGILMIIKLILNIFFYFYWCYLQ